MELLSLLLIKFPFHESSGKKALTVFSFGINCRLEVSESLRGAQDTLGIRMLIHRKKPLCEPAQLVL